MKRTATTLTVFLALSAAEQARAVTVEPEIIGMEMFDDAHLKGLREYHYGMTFVNDLGNGEYGFRVRILPERLGGGPYPP
ncbi:MAG: hypothetical protein ABIH34_06340 [Nanoarchaeota archaeon]